MFQKVNKTYFLILFECLSHQIDEARFHIEQRTLCEIADPGLLATTISAISGHWAHFKLRPWSDSNRGSHCRSPMLKPTKLLLWQGSSMRCI